jgi:acetyltransferase
VSGGFHPEFRGVLKNGNVPILQGTRESLWAIRHLIDFSRLQAGSPSRPEIVAGVDQPEIDHLFTTGNLSEHSSMQVLSAYGIPVIRHNLVSSLEEASHAASEIGYPVVLKVDSPDIQHKTDVGVVRLGLPDEQALVSAYSEIQANAQKAYPPARINGLLVQEMLDLKDAVEVIVGMTNDPQCGPALLFGLGGVLVEVFEDAAIRVAPLSSQDARAMLEEIRGTRILDGVRGKPPADKHAIVDVLVSLSRLAIEIGDRITELDINPLIVFPEGRGAVAADALIVTAQSPNVERPAD